MAIIYFGEKIASLTNGAGKLDTHTQKTDTRFPSLTLYKIQLKIVQRPNLRPNSLILLEENFLGETFQDIT
jgi:hypothetical protein